MEKDLQIVGLPHVVQHAKELIQQISSTQSLLVSLRDRFSRDFLTLLTFGLAGTGKSRTLVTLTGLPDTELISRKGDHCTGTIVEVNHNSQSERTYAVTTFSKDEFFRERVLPYFHSFSINTPPMSLEEFRSMDLPDLENVADLIGKKNAAQKLQTGRYEHLLQIHTYLDRFKMHLTGKTSPISINEVPGWTTYPNEH